MSISPLTCVAKGCFIRKVMRGEDEFSTYINVFFAYIFHTESFSSVKFLARIVFSGKSLEAQCINYVSALIAVRFFHALIFSYT